MIDAGLSSIDEMLYFFFSSRRRHTRSLCDWSSDVCSSDLLDGAGKAEISTGIGFLDHMLELFARHGLFDLSVRVTGDLHVDQHHTAEDTGIALGQAFREALGDKKGIIRYADIHLPMDETLSRL